MIKSIADFKNPFFIGIAGTGMSALAQYLQGIGKSVKGSDRFFREGEENDTRTKLEQEGIQCFLQDASGIDSSIDLVVVSTAIEDTVPEVQKARVMNIPVLRRSELLALIADSKKTIAVGGTSGKSTTTAMLFDILEFAGMNPSIISGAGLVSIIKNGKIGNAKVGDGDWLVIEADESDGSIVQYHSTIGLLLNIDKDHKEVETLLDLFDQFRNNSKTFVVNQSHHYARNFSVDMTKDFSVNENAKCGYVASHFEQRGLQISFRINGTPFSMNLLGRHNMENAVAAVAIASQIGVNLDTCARALKEYEGIYRRHQVIGNKNGVWLIDDYAHNPVKCAAAIQACQPVASKVVAWFQPHGYGPTKFLRNDFVAEISAVLRDDDEIWMSEIFYAGGTAVKDISAADLINDIRAKGKKAFFVEDRKNLLKEIKPHLSEDCVLLLMGARDPSLEKFAAEVWKGL